jgi:hypothetical protein
MIRVVEVILPAGAALFSVKYLFDTNGDRLSNGFCRGSAGVMGETGSPRPL